MAKLVVEIEMPESKFPTASALLNDILDEDDWWEDREKGLITVDEAFLRRASNDDSFFVFKLTSVVD